MRTNPAVKDTFIALTNFGLFEQDVKGTLRSSTANVHFVTDDCDNELSEFWHPTPPRMCPGVLLSDPPPKSVINHYRPGSAPGIPPLDEQRGNTVLMDRALPVTGGIEFLGSTKFLSGCPLQNRCLLGSTIYLRNIMLGTPPNRSYTISDEVWNRVDSRTTRTISAHEVGHGLSLDHYLWGARSQESCPGNRPKGCCKGRDALARGSCTPAGSPTPIYPSSALCDYLFCWAREACTKCKPRDPCTLVDPGATWANLPLDPLHPVYDPIDASLIKLW